MDKHKAIVPRKTVLFAARQLMGQVGHHQERLSVEFADETGHGLGPTLEFYSLVCRDLHRRDLGIWHDCYGPTAPTAGGAAGGAAGEAAAGGKMGGKASEVEVAYSYINAHSTGGLFPIAWPPSDASTHSLASEVASKATDHSTDHLERLKALKWFRFLGRFVGKALQDDRRLDIPFSEPLCKLLLGPGTGGTMTVEDLVQIDPVVGRSMLRLQHVARTAVRKKEREKEREKGREAGRRGSGGIGGMNGEEEESAVGETPSVKETETMVEDMCLTFVVRTD